MIVRADVLFLHTAPSLHLYTPKIPLKALAPDQQLGDDFWTCHVYTWADVQLEVFRYVYTHTHIYTHTMEYYSAMKRGKVLPCAATWWTRRVLCLVWDSQLAQWVKNPPKVQEMWVWSLDQEDPLEEGMATLSSILAWRIPWTEELGVLQSTGTQRIGHGWSNWSCTLAHA